MPALTFTLPHWLYWSTLVLFPLVAMYLVARQKRLGAPEGTSIFLAYMFWLMSGLMGMHRFYLRSRWGFAFLAVFLVILYVNVQIRDAREDVSRTRSEAQASHLQLERAQTNARREPSDEATQRVRQAETKSAADEQDFLAAQAELDQRRLIAQIGALIIAGMLLVDAVLIPRLVRKQREIDATLRAKDSISIDVPDLEGGTGQDPGLNVHTKFSDLIETIDTKIGYYVAYWAVISVFGYYYEVVARFVFNSPTNWVHESMFLMYGMQYMLAGAFAYREDQHVRVDVLYVKLSPRGKAICDIVTSLFFFIFVGTMLWTTAKFASDSIGFGERSFTEWQVQYWPVKLMMPIGAALLFLQGVAKLAKDIVILKRVAA